MATLPQGGIPNVAGLTTDGMIATALGVTLTAVDVTEVGDEGGWPVVLSGIFPAGVGFYVYVEAGAVSRRAYSGVLGQADVCYSADGVTLAFVSPPLPVGAGYDVRVIATDGSQGGALAAALPVWKRTYTTNLYSLRAAFPPPRAVGAYGPGGERWAVADTGDNDTLYSAVLTALADTLQETHGFLLTRVYAPHSAGATIVACEGLHRWPSTGRFALNGVLYDYTGRDAVFGGGTPATEHYCRLTGVTTVGSATAGPARQGDVLVYMGRDITDVDRVRASFMLATADGVDLDTLARNYGLFRPRGLTDTVFRALLGVLLYLPAQTIQAVKRVLDVLRPAAYQVYELFPLPGEFNRFYVVLSASGSSGGPRGRAYLTAFETVTSVGATVTLAQPVAAVNGVWADADPFRQGTNYAELVTAVQEFAPDQLRTAAAFWVAADEGRSVRLGTGTLWVVVAVLDPTHAQVAGPLRTDGITNAGDPTSFVAEGTAFRPWMVGHTLRVLSGPNAGDYAITAVATEYAITVAGAAFATETRVPFRVVPVFSGTPTTAAVSRATIAGSVVTCPNTLPSTVLVDYATTPSAEAVSDSYTSGLAQYPFYLFDDAFVVTLVLDLVRAAGVEAVVILE